MNQDSINLSLLKTYLESYKKDFNYSKEKTPRSITYDELVNSTIYAEHYPLTFSCTIGEPKPVDFLDQFQKYLDFTKIHSEDCPELTEAIYPIFCHVYMNYMQHGKVRLAKDFKSRFFGTIPSQFKGEAEIFVQGTDDRLQSLFASQRYIIYCSEKGASLFREFVNQPSMAQFRPVVLKAIILRLKIQKGNEKVAFSSIGSLAKTSLHVSTVTSASFAYFIKSGLYTINSSNTLYYSPFSSFKSVKLYQHPQQATSITVSRSGSLVASTDLAGNVNISSQTASLQIPSIGLPVWCSQFAPYGGALAYGTQNNLAHLINGSTGQRIRSFTGHNGPVTSLCFHPNCAYLATAGEDEAVRFWDIRDSSAAARIFLGDHATLVEISHNGQLIAYYDRTLNLVDIATGRPIAVRAIPNVTHIKFSLDDSAIYVIQQDRSLSRAKLYEWNISKPPSDSLNEEVAIADQVIIGFQQDIEGQLHVTTTPKF